MAEKKIDSSFLDRAIKYAVDAHQNVERRGKGFPYVVHPLEAMSIAATVTNDQEVLAAAALHDVVEDTDITIDELKKEFGERVAELVAIESDNMDPNYHQGISWKDRKVAGLRRIKQSSRDAQIVALGDKLSNMRAIYIDWLKIHEKIFDKFHEHDPSIHAWRYYQLSNCFDKLEGTYALEEFKFIVRVVFGEYLHDFRVEKYGRILKIYGKISLKCIEKIEEEMEKIDGDPYLDFENVAGIDAESIRALYRLAENGKRYFIRNANKNISYTFYSIGVCNLISITELPREIDLNDYEVSGDGYTAVSYNHKDGDTMMKLYAPFIAPEEVEKEKTVATRAFTLGVNTPLCIELVSYNGQMGITFERIKGKRSFARAISEEPEHIKEYVDLFTDAVMKLHHTECDTTLFNPVTKSFLHELEVAKDRFTDEEYLKVENFIKENNKETTCIHGDLHTGNLLITENKDVLFIDMADFSYGNPNFDVATLYVMTNIISEERMLQLFHVNKKTMAEVWDLFVRKYYNVSDKEEIEKINEFIKPYAGVRILQFANRSKWYDGGIASHVKELLFHK